jgi:hypothetical protein
VSDLRLPGRETNNPLVVLNAHLETITAQLSHVVAAMEHQGAHVYALAQANLPVHGAVWGAFCQACSDEAQHYVYPCRLHGDEPLKPPQFFTIGRAFSPRDDGGFLVFENGVPTPE